MAKHPQCDNERPHLPHRVHRAWGIMDCPGELPPRPTEPPSPPLMGILRPTAEGPPPTAWEAPPVPPEWLDTEGGYDAGLSTAQQVRSEALRAASGLYLAHADCPEAMGPVADAVLGQARRFAHYIETGE